MVNARPWSRQSLVNSFVLLCSKECRYRFNLGPLFTKSSPTFDDSDHEIIQAKNMRMKANTISLSMMTFIIISKIKLYTFIASVYCGLSALTDSQIHSCLLPWINDYKHNPELHNPSKECIKATHPPTTKRYPSKILIMFRKSSVLLLL